MIDSSLRCFWLGLFGGLLPIIGVPMAMRALVYSRRVKRGQGGMWNPAGRYRFWGSIMARIGLWGVTIVVALAILVKLYS